MSSLRIVRSCSMQDKNHHIAFAGQKLRLASPGSSPISASSWQVQTTFVPIRLIQWHGLAQGRTSNAQILVAPARAVFHWNAAHYHRCGAGPVTTTNTAKTRSEVHQQSWQCQDQEFRTYRAAGQSRCGERQHWIG